MQIRHYTNLNYIARDTQVKPKSLDKPNVDWIYGKTGCGKSYTARKECEDANLDYYVKSANTKWWCGYKNEPVIIIDDIDIDHKYMAFQFKIWFDRYAFQAESKGFSRMIRPVKIICTSNYHPKDIWKNSSDINPILRRVKVIRMANLVRVDEEEKIDDEVRHSYAEGFVGPSSVHLGFQNPLIPEPLIDFSYLDNESIVFEDIFNENKM